MHSPRPGLFAHRDSFEPKAKGVARENSKQRDRSQNGGGGNDRTHEWAAIEKLLRAEIGNGRRGRLLCFSHKLGMKRGRAVGVSRHIDRGD
jgi:hypothetical protein